MTNSISKDEFNAAWNKAREIRINDYKKIITSIKIIAEAKEEAARIIARANAEIELEKKRALDDMKQEMITIASMIAEKVVAIFRVFQQQNCLVKVMIWVRLLVTIVHSNTS